ncbi:hypothetical protein PoB_006765600 [Plakobranchus ocellatus]|uniref:Mutator-like transposase domain-containing protein n=1 Tax=Plakobranchus ocellatus TaxID=259542 RepID=A0AAV4DAR0_9GAST|nr:hypothetical protein PoB_006765600 [Plakobranchus ocellatus]
MDMPSDISKSTVSYINNKISDASMCAKKDSMLLAAKEEFEFAESNESAGRNIDVSVDGSWMTRGHSSSIGVTSLIGLVTGKVLDTVTLSRKCKSCDYWEKQDKNSANYVAWKTSHECSKNHHASAGSMEGDSTVIVFNRSVNNYSLGYMRYIGDGDTNSLRKVHDSQPYGPEEENQIEKIECVGHVQKRMGTRLRKFKDSYKSKKLKDDKTIGEKGRLTDEKIDRITTYYVAALLSTVLGAETLCDLTSFTANTYNLIDNIPLRTTYNANIRASIHADLTAPSEFVLLDFNNGMIYGVLANIPTNLEANVTIAADEPLSSCEITAGDIDFRAWTRGSGDDYELMFFAFN